MTATPAIPNANTDCFVHDSTAELVHAQLGVVFLFEYLILCLDLKLYLKRNPNSAIVYPHWRRPTPPAVQREIGEGGSEMDTDKVEKNHNMYSSICETLLSFYSIYTVFGNALLEGRDVKSSVPALLMTSQLFFVTN